MYREKKIFDEETIKMFAKAKKLKAKYIVTSFKIQGSIKEIEQEPIFVLEEDNLEKVRKEQNDNWKRVRKVYVMEELYNDFKINQLIENQYIKQEILDNITDTKTISLVNSLKFGSDKVENKE